MNLFELFASFHITGMDFVLSYYREGLQLIDIHTFKLKKSYLSPGWFKNLLLYVSYCSP